MSKESKEMCLSFVIDSMLCMLKESKKVIKIHSNRLDIYIYCHVKMVESTPLRIKHIKCTYIERVKSEFDLHCRS